MDNKQVANKLALYWQEAPENMKDVIADACRILKEQKQGEWIKANETDIKCSVCGHREERSRLLVTELNYCSLCGAIMKRGDT